MRSECHRLKTKQGPFYPLVTVTVTVTGALIQQESGYCISSRYSRTGSRRGDPEILLGSGPKRVPVR